MPVQYEGIRRSTSRCEPRRRLRRLPHGRDRDARRAPEFLQHLLSNDVTKIAERGAQYSVICKPDGGVIDDLFTYRLDDGGFLTVTNASNHDKDLAWFQQQAASSTSRSSTRRRLRDARRPGPQRTRPSSASDLTDGDEPERMRFEHARSPASTHGLRHRLHRRGRRRAADRPGRGDDRLGRPDRRGVKPAGLGARDTLRLEVCFHLYGNDLSEDRNPIEAGLGWACKLDTGFIGADTLQELRAHPEDRPVRLHRQGRPAPGQRVVIGGETVARSRAARCRPASNTGIGMAYVPSPREPGTAIEIDIRGASAPPRCASVPCTAKES